jgi:hypothetical protein
MEQWSFMESALSVFQMHWDHELEAVLEGRRENSLVVHCRDL